MIGSLLAWVLMVLPSDQLPKVCGWPGFSSVLSFRQQLIHELFLLDELKLSVSARAVVAASVILETQSFQLKFLTGCGVFH